MVVTGPAQARFANKMNILENGYKPFSTKLENKGQNRD